MSNAPYFLTSLRLSGFRAYLDPKTFNLSKKTCLAIFAPNGSGKSSVIDALEFMFSKDGTLERLGLRAINNNAGFAALAHNLAEEAKITPNVRISTGQGEDVVYGDRPATGANRPMPELANRLKACFAVDPIIRGHALRSFVEHHTPEQRYADVATWLQLGPLVEVQKNLRMLRSQVKAESDDATPLRRIDTQLARHTSQAIKTWDEVTVLAHVNAAVLAPLDATLSLSALTLTDPGYIELEKRAKAEENKLGLAGLRLIHSSAAGLCAKTSDASAGDATHIGAIPAFDAAVGRLEAAATKESDERGKAERAAFQALWKAAEPLFDESVIAPEECPVCTTPIADSKAGDAVAIRGHLALRLEKLADYATAKGELDTAKAAATHCHGQLLATLPRLISLLDDTHAALKVELVAYKDAIADWQQGVPADSAYTISAIDELVTSIGLEIGEIQAKQGDHTYAKAKSKIDTLFELQADRGLMVRTQGELKKLSESLGAQTATISGEIRKRLQTLLNRLQSPMNEIYKLMQGAGGVPIRLELPPEDDTNQQRLNLVIDFAKNRVGVQPGGYLSDSQIHSVALALRMAAIKEFNAAAPIIALDDIVTSYDADHRRTIAGLFATIFADCQILITTHDERFFNYLKDQLATNTWAFTRIIGLDLAHGPRFADHKVSDEMIQARWTDGLSAANEIRQAEEEWLLRVSREFGVSVRIRALEKAYEYERSELASALAGFLKDNGLKPAPVPGINNRFLDSLQKGVIENFGSHFQDGIYGGGSIGDEKARWEEFKTFRNQFACKKCSRIRFQRPISLKKPVCAHEDCEAQFEFVPTAAVGP
jgi:recombinational DNA repair ATPase RecF